MSVLTIGTYGTVCIYILVNPRHTWASRGVMYHKYYSIRQCVHIYQMYCTVCIAVLLYYFTYVKVLASVSDSKVKKSNKSDKNSPEVATKSKSKIKK